MMHAPVAQGLEKATFSTFSDGPARGLPGACSKPDTRMIVHNTKGFSHTVGWSGTWDPARLQIKDNSLVKLRTRNRRSCLALLSKSNVISMSMNSSIGPGPWECSSYKSQLPHQQFLCSTCSYSTTMTPINHLISVSILGYLHCAFSKHPLPLVSTCYSICHFCPNSCFI